MKIEFTELPHETNYFSIAVHNSTWDRLGNLHPITMYSCSLSVAIILNDWWPGGLNIWWDQRSRTITKLMHVNICMISNQMRSNQIVIMQVEWLCIFKIIAISGCFFSLKPLSCYWTHYPSDQDTSYFHLVTFSSRRCPVGASALKYYSSSFIRDITRTKMNVWI